MLFSAFLFVYFNRTFDGANVINKSKLENYSLEYKSFPDYYADSDVEKALHYFKSLISDNERLIIGKGVIYGHGLGTVIGFFYTSRTYGWVEWIGFDGITRYLLSTSNSIDTFKNISLL